MIAAIRAELRKLVTVRSTYGIIAFCLFITVLYAFYASGLRETQNVADSGAYTAIVLRMAQLVAFIISFIALLSLTHEYRYNTILYTLTSSRSRSDMLLAKIIVLSASGIVLTLAICASAPLLMSLGLHIHGLSIVPQNLYFADLGWRVAFYGWAYSMLALIAAAIIRNQVGSFAVMFLLPGIGEALLSFVLKNNAVYLPFTALTQVLISVNSEAGSTSLSPGNAALVVCAYVIAGWLVAWLLLMRRDAN